tara:strand:+ start:3081 stop:4031 length:951 start_codon:yes stop_codon:yes gene_type:complete
MSNEHKVAVLMGGFSSERDISLRSGQAIWKALQRNNISAVPFDPKFRPLTQLIDEKIKRVFIALHGTFGEDGYVQGILEYLRIPFTGSGMASSALAMDKIQAKRIFKSVGLRTPEFLTLKGNERVDLSKNTDIFPAILKPNSEGSSLGVEKVETPQDLEQARLKVIEFGENMLLEKFVSGREFTCAVLQLGPSQSPVPLPIVEVIAPEGNYNFHNKYEGDKTKYICPPKLPLDVIRSMEESSLKAFNTLGCRHWARVDFIWNETGEPEILELNTVPGMTEKSLVPMAASKNGLTFDELVLKILNNASLETRFYNAC